MYVFVRLIFGAVMLLVAGLAFNDFFDSPMIRYSAAAASFAVTIGGILCIVLERRERDKYRDANVRN